MNRSFIQSPLGISPQYSSGLNIIKPVEKSSKGVIVVGAIFILMIGIVIYGISRSFAFSLPIIALAIIFLVIGLLSGKKKTDETNQYKGFGRY